MNPFDQFDGGSNPFDKFDKKQASYIDSQTGKTVPIENAGKPAQEGSAIGGVLEGVTNTALGIPNAVLKGLSGLSGTMIPGGSVSDSFDNAPQIPTFSGGGPETAAARSAVEKAVGTAATALPKALDVAYTASRKSPLTGLDKAQDAKDEALPRAALDVIGNLAPMLIGPKAIKTEAEIPRTNAFKDARDLGLVIPPSFAAIKGGKTMMGPAIEGMVGGAAKSTVDASVKNAPVITARAAEDIPSIPKGTELTPDVLEAAKAPYQAVYQKVSALGNIAADPTYVKAIEDIEPNLGKSFPKSQGKGVNADIAELKDIYTEPNFDAADALQHVKELRDNARANYAASGNPSNKNVSSLKRLAEAQNTIADALIDQMDRWAESEGFEKSGLGDEFRDARQNLAKIFTLEDSIKPGTTDVSASYLANQLNKGKKLSGNMLRIAEAYNNFSPAMKDAGPLRNKVPINRMDAMVGGAGAGLGIMKHEPNAALAAAGYVLAPPLTRKILLSDAYQNSMLPKDVMASQLSPGMKLTAAFTGQQTYEQQLAKQLMGIQ